MGYEPSTPLSTHDLLMLRSVLDDSALETGRRNVAALQIIRLFQSDTASRKKLGAAVKKCIPEDDELCQTMSFHLLSGLAAQSFAPTPEIAH